MTFAISFFRSEKEECNRGRQNYGTILTEISNYLRLKIMLGNSILSPIRELMVSMRRMFFSIFTMFSAFYFIYFIFVPQIAIKYILLPLPQVKKIKEAN
jgi:hypothetical protein